MALDLLVQNTTSERIVEIPGVQLNQTEEDLQVILETPTGQQPVPLILPEGNNLIIDILDATLNNVQFTLAGFFNYSDNGANLTPDEETGFLVLERSPQRIYGVEATLDWQPRESWLLDSTACNYPM